MILLCLKHGVMNFSYVLNTQKENNKMELFGGLYY